MTTKQELKAAILRVLRPRSIELSRAILAWLSWASGITLLLRLIISPRGAAILGYHSIEGRGVFPDNVVSLKHFKQHVKYLQKHHTLVSVSDIVAPIGSTASIPDDWAAITFDDGYKDNLLHGVPVLTKAQAPAIFLLRPP